MNVYEIITERILAELNKGTLPWSKPWKSALGEEPANLLSKKGYRGINRFLLSCAPYARPYYLTYKQATEAGGTVKKGEHGTPVVFWKKSTYATKEEDGSEAIHNGMLLRYYTVFNVEQCEGIDKLLPATSALPTNPLPPIPSAERIVAKYKNGPSVREVPGDRAFYRPSTDSITMPERGQFNSQAEYYSTLFHELTHSTGHADRLKRTTLLDSHFFGDQEYSREELIAEMGAAFLCGTANLDNEAALKNSASYVDGWRKKLKGDSKLVVIAAAQAQKAADHILGVQWSEA